MMLFEETARVTTSAIDGSGPQQSSQCADPEVRRARVGADWTGAFSCATTRSAPLRTVRWTARSTRATSASICSSVRARRRPSRTSGEPWTTSARRCRRSRYLGTDQPRLPGRAGRQPRPAKRTAPVARRTSLKARTAYRRAVEIGQESLPEQALGASLRWGAWESRHRSWTPAVQAYEFGLAALSGWSLIRSCAATRRAGWRTRRSLPPRPASRTSRPGSLLGRRPCWSTDGRCCWPKPSPGRARLTAVRASVPGGHPDRDLLQRAVAIRSLAAAVA